MGCKKGKTLFNLFYLCFIIRTGMSEIIRERESCDKMMSSVFSLAVLHSLFHTLREAAPRSGFRCVGWGVYCAEWCFVQVCVHTDRGCVCLRALAGQSTQDAPL